MKFPIIEFRQNNLFVVTELRGTICDDTITFRHNLIHNLTRYVVDSNGDLWSLTFVRTNRVGLRKIVGFFWNVSSDYYTYTKTSGATVAEFRGIVEPYLLVENPDDSELAAALLEPLAQCQSEQLLRHNIHLLNL